MSRQVYFLWDYDLSKKDVRRILRDGSEQEKIWLASRILESARYKDVWKYLTLNEIAEFFPKLRLKKPVRRAWKRALQVWGVLPK